MFDWIFWLALSNELSIWKRKGCRPALWWRDDDARRPSAALDRLIALSHRINWPVLLAIIPDDDVDGLAARIAQNATLLPAQHGASHANHARPGEPPAEIPEGEDLAVAIARLEPALARMKASAIAPICYVPPWNRVAAPTPAALAALGGVRMSGFGEFSCSEDSVRRLDTHVDVLRWGVGARFRGARRIFDRLRRELEARRKRRLWREPIGLLTHHLDHDEATWRFLAAFLPVAGRHFELLAPGDAFDRTSQS